MTIYLIGSLSNPNIPHIANQLRKMGHEVFDDWWSPGAHADEEWRKHEMIRGRTFRQAIYGEHATEVYRFDRNLLERSNAVVMVLPTGKSGHLELGWAIGKGKRGYILFDKEPDRFDIMYRLATGIAMSIEELEEELENGHQNTIEYSPF